MPPDDGSGTGLDTTARDAERARVEALVHAIHPTADITINAEGGQQVIVDGNQVWTIVPTAGGVEFRGADGAVHPNIPGLALPPGQQPPPPGQQPPPPGQQPVEDEAALQARLRAEGEADANAGLLAAEQAALAQTAAEAGAAPATPVLGPAQPQQSPSSDDGFTLGTESEGSESEPRNRASSMQSTAHHTTWDIPGMPYLLQNGHPNPGFVLRFLQAYDVGSEETKTQELRTVRDSFNDWWTRSGDKTKDAFDRWDDHSGQNYVGVQKNTDKFMDAITRAVRVDRSEPQIEAAIENAPLARGDSLSTVYQSDARQLDETSEYPSPTRTAPAPESPGSAPASPLPSPVQMPPLPQPPESSLEKTLRLVSESRARGAEQAALASGNQAAQAAAANSKADRPAVRRPSLQEVLARAPAGDTSEAQAATERLRAGIGRGAAVNAQAEAEVAAATDRRVAGSNEPLVNMLLNRDRFGVRSAINRQLTRGKGRRGKGRKSTFRKKRKNKK